MFEPPLNNKGADSPCAHGPKYYINECVQCHCLLPVMNFPA